MPREIHEVQRQVENIQGPLKYARAYINDVVLNGHSYHGHV